MLIAIRHVTRYAYADAADYSIESLRMTPLSFNGQKVLGWRLQVEGGALFETGRDGYGNIVHLATVIGRHEQVVITAEGEVEVEDRHGMVSGLVEPSPPRVYLRRTPHTAADAAIEALVAEIGAGDAISRLHSLSALIGERLGFEVGATDAHTSAGEALADGRGVCQDYAHIFIAGARQLGIPARYVTGYLLDGGEGASEAHHAWAEAHVGDLGWIGFDVANGLCPTDHYVRLACGLDARCAAPVRGSRQGGEHEVLDVRVVVQQNNNAQQ